METTAAIPLSQKIEALIGSLPREFRETAQSIVTIFKREVDELKMIVRLREEQLRMAQIDKYGPRSEPERQRR